MNIVFIAKRHYTKHDLIEDRFGRLFHFPRVLAQLGHQVKVFAADYKGGINEVRRLEGVELHSISRGLFGFEACVGFTFATIEEFNPDVIIASGHTHLLLIGKLVAERLNRPFFADVYDYYPSFSGAGILGHDALFRRLLKCATGALFASHALQSELHGHCSSSIVLPNAVDKKVFRSLDYEACRREFGYSESDRVIALTGSLELSRGLGCLISAVQEVEKRGVRMHLALAGGPDVLPGQLPVSFKYFGKLPQEKLARLINASDIAAAVYSSKKLNRYVNSCKLIEYLHCEVPVVASRIGDNAQVLGEGFPGLCAPDDPFALADSICCQLSDPQLPKLEIEYTWSALGADLDAFIRSNGKSSIS